MALATGCASTRDADLGWTEPVVSGHEAPAQPAVAPAIGWSETDAPLLAQHPGRVSKNTGRVFVGYTTERGGGGVTVGGQYEVRLNDQFGVGGLVDLVFASKFSVVGAAAFFWHPLPNLVVLGAPGYSWSRKDEFITRVGASYEFELKDRSLSIAPALYVDLIADDTPVIAGVYISKKF
jgi:hypothetical protein